MTTERTHQPFEYYANAENVDFISNLQYCRYNLASTKRYLFIVVR